MSGFSTKLFQSQQLRQEMKINPRLYHAMELLYLPLQDLNCISKRRWRKTRSSR